MDNLKQFNTMSSDDNWRTQSLRQNVVSKIDDVIQRSGMQVARNGSEMENTVFMKAQTREEYMNMVAKLILHVREMSQPKQQVTPNMQGPNQGQGGPNTQVQNQPGQPPQGQSAPDPINALQNLASQGTRNQMMNMGPQGQMQQQMGPNPGMGGMQGQMGQQGPIVSQGGPQGQPASNLLQTLNQRPQLNIQHKLQGMLPGNIIPGQNPMGGQIGNMGMNTLQSQLQNQLAAGGGMPMMPINNMGGANSMVGQMQGNQVMPGMGGQMPSGNMPGQMPGQMAGNMGNNQMAMGMMHMQGRMGKSEFIGGYAGARGPAPQQFLRQSPSPSAPSPAMSGPSPSMENEENISPLDNNIVDRSVMGGAMSSPLSLGGVGCGGSPSPSAPHLAHHGPPQSSRSISMNMVTSPSSSVNTPVGAGVGVASPGGDEAAYRDKVRQLSKYIEPLRRMVHRMVSEGENVEKLTKMKNLLDILSNPNKRMPLETLIKCEVVLEKLDFKRSESVGLGLPTSQGKEQIFNPLLEVVNNCLQSPLANHTLKRTFGSTLDALNGPEIKNLPLPQKIAKIEEPVMEIPDVLQGEIARLDSRFKVSLESAQLAGGAGGVSLVCALDEQRLPAAPPAHLHLPRHYPRAPPARLQPAPPARHPPGSFLARLHHAMDARCARLPKSCSVGQLLDAWEMSVRQACAPNPVPYNPVPALGL